MEGRAMVVLERLVGEDDQSVEAWYLGGWCQVLQAEKLDQAETGKEEKKKKKKGAREWLRNSLKLYELLDYEDERLKDHAIELVTALNQELGVEDEGDEEEEWQDESDGGETGEDLEATDGDGDAEMT